MYYFNKSNRFIFLFVFALASFVAYAQQNVIDTSQSIIQPDSVWSIQRCVDYALKNNISVKQADIQSRVAKLQANQVFLTRFPNLSFSANNGFGFGRTISYITNQYVASNTLNTGFGLSAGEQIFSFGKINNTIAQTRFNALAALYQFKQASDNVTLSILAAYLQAMSASELINTTKLQIDILKKNIDFTAKKLEVGSIAELDLLQLQNQLATDSFTLFSNIQAYQQSLIALKVLLNLDFNIPFTIDKTELTKLPILPIAEVAPDILYTSASQFYPIVLAGKYQIESAKKGIKIARASFLPVLGGSIGVNSGYFAQLGATLPNTPAQLSFPAQLANNITGSIGFALSVPIFSNGSTKLAYEQSKYALKTAGLTQELNLQQLRNDIYTNYNNTIAAYQKLATSRKAYLLTQRISNISNKKYQVGSISAFELITNQNNAAQTQIQLITNEYECILRMKILEYYKGQGVKLE